MKYFLIIISVWFLGGIISLVLSSRYKLPFTYKLLLFLEGVIGLIFLLFFRGIIEEGLTRKDPGDK
jgi:hypothetical protein